MLLSPLSAAIDMQFGKEVEDLDQLGSGCRILLFFELHFCNWFMKFAILLAFTDTKGVVKLRRWFEKTKSVFGISECIEGKKVKFAAATLQGLALTWWNAKVTTMGLETVNQMPWTEMK
ncbi:hypothetical protein Tco_0391201 [Tanacetum coccineum]